MIFGAVVGTLVILVLCIAPWERAALAGKKAESPLGFDPNGAWGALATARSSSDETEFIKCELVATDSGRDLEGVLTAKCIFHNKVDHKFCVSANKAVIAAIQAVSEDSRISITINPVTNDCTIVKVTNSSEYMKVP